MSQTVQEPSEALVQVWVELDPCLPQNLQTGGGTWRRILFAPPVLLLLTASIWVIHLRHFHPESCQKCRSGFSQIRQNRFVHLSSSVLRLHLELKRHPGYITMILVYGLHLKPELRTSSFTCCWTIKHLVELRRNFKALLDFSPSICPQTFYNHWRC